VYLANSEAQLSKAKMELESFLQRFEHIGRLRQIRDTCEFDHADFDREQLRLLAMEVVTKYRSILKRDVCHRFLDVCIQLLYRDLRSFDALTIILDNAILSPSIFGVDGANAIVALTCVVDDLPLDEKAVLVNKLLLIPKNHFLYKSATGFLGEIAT